MKNTGDFGRLLPHSPIVGPLYDVILADPPWKFSTWSPRGNGKGPERHYPTMTLDALRALEVNRLAADNCALFLWACWPSIFRDVPGLLESWGFEYRSCAFLWVKANRSGSGFFTGLGYYTRANTEPCLLAIKGKMPVAAHDVPQVLYSPVQGHSQKPADQYNRIERLYPGRRYLELFARRKQPGWSVWGNEVDSDLVVEYSPTVTRRAYEG